MTINKWSFLQLRIIRKDHEGFQVDHILDIIGEQSLQRFLIPISLIILPQKNGKISINPIQLPSVNARLPFTTLILIVLNVSKPNHSAVDIALLLRHVSGL